MPRTIHLLFFIIFITACSTHRQRSSYRILQQTTHSSDIQQQASAIKQISKNLFITGSFTGSTGGKIMYRLLSPAHTEAGRRYPLVLVFHGSGAIGNDNESQLGVLSKMWASEYNRNHYPCYVLVPQFAERSANYHTDSTKQVLSSVPSKNLSTALELLDSLQQHLPVDSNHVYVTGFSMGASATYNALLLRPRTFAAGIAIAGVPNFEQEKQLLHTPLWIIHGNADTENIFRYDSLFYHEMKAQGAKQIRFWELDKTGHEIIPELYTGDEIPKWLFQWRKK